MPSAPDRNRLSEWRAQVARLESRQEQRLPFGVAPLDSRLAGGGLGLASLHEVAPASPALSDDAAATLFLAGITARCAAVRRGTVLWVVTRFDLYAPGLEQAGLGPARLLYAEARDDHEALALMEDGLRDGALAAAVAEVKRAGMAGTRRLQLAAASGQTPAFLLRRWRKPDQRPLEDMSAAATRWYIGCEPPERPPLPGVARARWSVELVRQRGGEPFALTVEACDETGRLAIPAVASDRAAPATRAVKNAA